MSSTLNKNDCKNCPFKAKIFHFLSAVELEAINKSRIEIEYNPGEIIFKQGAPYTHAISFSHGLAKIYIETEKKSSLIIKLLKEQAFLSGPGLYAGEKHIFSVMAVEKTGVCAIDKSIFQNLLTSNPIFQREFLKIQNTVYLELLTKLIDINKKNAKGKVAGTLLYLADEIYNSNPFQLTLSITEISDFTGLSKESTFRTLKEFVDAGYITLSKKAVHIHNKVMLQKISING